MLPLVSLIYSIYAPCGKFIKESQSTNLIIPSKTVWMLVNQSTELLPISDPTNNSLFGFLSCWLWLLLMREVDGDAFRHPLQQRQLQCC